MQPPGLMRDFGRRLSHDRLAQAALVLAMVAGALHFANERIASSPAEAIVVADLRGRALLVIDPTRPQSPARIALPGGPHEMARLPDGRLAVSLEQSGMLALVDLASGEVRAIEVGGLPHGLAVHAGVLFVTDRSIDAVRRFDVDTWREQPPIAAGAWPHAVAVLADGTLLVANARDGSIHIGDRRIEVSALPETVAVSADGTRIATAGAEGGVVEVFGPDGRPLQRIKVGGRPVRVSWSPDGGTLAVALSAAHAVALIDVTGEIRLVQVAGTPDGLAFTPDSRRLFASDTYGGRVTAIDVRTARVAAVLEAGEATGALFVVASR